MKKKAAKKPKNTTSATSLHSQKKSKKKEPQRVKLNVTFEQAIDMALNTPIKKK
jgi:hypothetical protein